MTKKILSLKALDRETFVSVIVISVIVSGLSMIVPIAAQWLVNIVAFTRVMQPIILVSIIVLIILSATALLSLWQHIIVETIQQKLFAKVTIDCARKLPFLHRKVFEKYRGPELVNQFFDVVTVQKSLADILLYGTNIVLYSFFGMVVLAFYHPYFIVFDLLLIIGLLLSICIPYKTAIAMAREECSQKHLIGAWLEEIVHNPNLFRFSKHHRFALREADNRLVGYLRARNTHFKMLLYHLSGIYGISVLATTGLLGLGGYLVIKNQLSLGQFVAAEIILSSVVNSFKQLGILLKDYYDMVASADKVNHLVNLPLVNNEGHVSSFDTVKTPQSLHLDIENFGSEQAPMEALINAQAHCGKPLCLDIKHINATKVLIEFISGFPVSHSGRIKVNSMLVNHYYWYELKSSIMRLHRLEIFSGTIEDNLLLGKHVSHQEIYGLMSLFELEESIIKLPNGLKTSISSNELVLNLTQLKKIMLIRALLSVPKLLIMDEFLDDLSYKQCKKIATILCAIPDLTIIVSSRQQSVLSCFHDREKPDAT